MSSHLVSAPIQHNFALFDVKLTDKQRDMLHLNHQGRFSELQFINGNGCRSYLGRIGEITRIVVNDCIYPGPPVHEFIHALGYEQMHNRSERDKGVKIQLEVYQSSLRNKLFNCSTTPTREEPLSFFKSSNSEIIHFPFR